MKKVWFDQILTGIKKIEYREIKPYWTKRLFTETGYPKKYTTIIFKNGYSKDAPTIEAECKKILKGKKHYEIHIGK